MHGLLFRQRMSVSSHQPGKTPVFSRARGGRAPGCATNHIGPASEILTNPKVAAYAACQCRFLGRRSWGDNLHAHSRLSSMMTSYEIIKAAMDGLFATLPTFHPAKHPRAHQLFRLDNRRQADRLGAWVVRVKNGGIESLQPTKLQVIYWRVL